MIRTFLTAAVVLMFAAGSLTPANAAACRDAKGKFTKCPPAATKPAAKGTKCRNAKGHFAKCGTPGAK